MYHNINYTYLNRLLTLFVILMFSITSFALEASEFTFKHLGTQEGMLSQRVYSICQTADGAIWWATKRGVSRTNGAKIRNYNLDAEASYNSFAGRTIRIANTTEAQITSDCLIAFDNSGRIFKYNVPQNRFDKIVDITTTIKTSNTALNDALITDKGILLATSEGIYLLKDNSLKSVKKGIYANCFISSHTKEGIILAGTNSGTFKVASKDDSTFTLTKFADCNAESGYYDSKNNKIWFGTFDVGLHLYDIKKGTLSEIPGVPNNPIRSITPYDDNTVLIGIDGYGVYEASRKAPATGKLLFDANEGPNGVLHGNGVYSVVVDSWSNILVGTYSGGIDIARPVGSTTAIFKHTQNNLQSLINDHVNCVMELSDDILLMGTDDGVSQYNSSTGTWKHSGRGMVVLDMCKTPDGRILAATYGNGVCELSSDGVARQVYSLANGTLKDDHVYKLLYDKDGNLWMGCLSGQLAEKTNEGIRYYDINNVQTLVQMPDGRIAVGSAYGLYLVKPGNKQLEEVRYLPTNTQDPNRFVFDLYIYSKDDLWIATDGGGVYRYNTKSGSCKQITTDDGLPSNSVYNIDKDCFGRLWFGTENGLAFIDPKNGSEVVNVSYCYGLEREYVRNAVQNLSNGGMLFGSVDGAIIINPKNIQKLNYSASLHILGARLSQADEDFNAKAYKMLENGEICVDYSQRSFELFYEGINLRNQFDIAYKHKIGDGEWSRLTDNQSIHFENMEPGVHELCIQCVSKTSEIVLDEKNISIYISEPWWNSWWMWCVYLALIAVAFVGAWQVYTLHSKYMRLVVDELQIPLADQKDKGARTNPSDNNAEGESEDISSKDEEDEEETPLDTAFVDSATKVILDNLSNPDFTIDTLCQEMAMSRTLFYVKLKSYTGKSPQDFIRVIRLERAASLLRSGSSVSDVSALVGFDNPKYFSTVFKKYFGTSPSKYK